MINPTALVQKLWNYCSILRDDGLSYGDYVEQLTFLLILKMADEQLRVPFNKPWSISVVLDGGTNFFPDFVIGVEGRKTEDGGLLANPKFGFEITQEQP